MAHRDPEFAYLAHDLSQLLWAIQGRARALAARLGPDGDTARSIAEDAAAAAAMLSGTGEPVADPVTVAAAAWRQAAPDLAGEIAVTCQGPATAPMVAVPPHVLHRILGNLFANAVEAMPGGGGIAWDATPAGDRVTISVQDTGPGIAPDLRSRLFETGATAGKAAGHGLGLAGSRMLARHHGGDLICVDTANGARFELDLAAAAAGPPETAAVPGVTPTSLRILVVDDERPVREMLNELLASEGHLATVAADHDAALARWQPGSYDAALIDLGLPGRDGAALARSLRDGDPSLAVVMLTGWGRETELAALDAELVDFTATKPIDLPQLRQLLGRAARLTAARRGSTDPKE